MKLHAFLLCNICLHSRILVYKRNLCIIFLKNPKILGSTPSNINIIQIKIYFCPHLLIYFGNNIIEYICQLVIGYFNLDYDIHITSFVSISRFYILVFQFHLFYTLRRLKTLVLDGHKKYWTQIPSKPLKRLLKIESYQVILNTPNFCFFFLSCWYFHYEKIWISYVWCRKVHNKNYTGSFYSIEIDILQKSNQLVRSKNWLIS